MFNSHKKEPVTDIHNYMDVSQKQYVEWKNLLDTECMPCASIYVTF